MSQFLAPLSKFQIEKHPNADTLSIAKVGDWQCVVRSTDFEGESLAVYLPLDSIADIDHPLLYFLKGKRIETCKLRGVLSQGVLLPFKDVVKYMQEKLGMSEESIAKVSVEGRDFAGILRVKRWIEIRQNQSGDAISSHPAFQKYTDIENIKNFNKIIQLGEEVHITEKLHGTSARFAIIDDTYMIGSRGRSLKVDIIKTVWHYISEKEKLMDKLLQFSEIVQKKNVAIYGEIVGRSIQDLNYGHLEPEFYCYDLLVDNVYLDPLATLTYTKQLGIKHVPHLWCGPFNEDLLKLRLGNSTLDNTHVREGIVIKPIVPKWHEEVGRVVLKVISEDYLMRKGATDIRDE